MMHEMEVAGMGIDSESQAPVLLLRQINGGEPVPIVIGLFEAASIVMALKDDVPERPMTHDLFCNFIGDVGMYIDKITIYDFKNGVYYSNICYKSRKDPDFTFQTDSRPSDAVALALRFKAPIFMDEKVIKAAGESFSVESGEDFEPADPVDKSEEGKKWAEYLKNLSDDEFGKYKV
jgi:bifunctional DNase/RNase